MQKMNHETTETSDTGHPEDREVKSFLAHLEDLRKTIVCCFVSLIVGMVIAFPFTAEILNLVKEPMTRAGLDPAEYLKVTQLAAGFSIAMRIIFWGGLLISTPALLYFIARFVFPGLTQRERRIISRSLLAAVGLFVGGVCMGYYMTVPVAIRVMTQITAKVGVTYDFIELADYVTFVLQLLLAFGLAFELPMIVLILGMLGIVDSKALRTKRRHVVVGLLVLAMLLTPPDPWTMIMMSVPLIGLYEICIWLVWLHEKKAARSRDQ